MNTGIEPPRESCPPLSLGQKKNAEDAAPFGAPPLFSATATSTSNVGLSWVAVSGATGYEVHRSSLNGLYNLVLSTGGTTANDTTVSGGTTYLYKVRALGSSGASAFSAIDPATTIVFTDPSLTGVAVKAVHITELRSAINAMRAAAGLSAATFADSSIAGVTIRAVHITELRAALDAARSTIGLAPLSYTDPTITVGTTRIKTSHFTELRAGTQ